MAGEPRAPVAVVVPAYRSQLDADERISLRHLNRFLSRYDRYLVLPRNLDLALDGFKSERFPDRFFRSSHSYSSLCLSRRLYRRFRGYEYILIYQLDSLVFADELGEWCRRGYDYVGALHEIAGVRLVGNGGFSLRRVPSFLAVLDSRIRMVDPGEHWQRHWAHRSTAARIAATPRRLLKHLRPFNGVAWDIRQRLNSPYEWGEDWFWSQRAAHYLPGFRKPAHADAERFAFFGEPRDSYEAVGRRLPFGCHGWNRFDRDFWKPFLLAR